MVQLTVSLFSLFVLLFSKWQRLLFNLTKYTPGSSQTVEQRLSQVPPNYCLCIFFFNCYQTMLILKDCVSVENRLCCITCTCALLNETRRSEKKKKTNVLTSVTETIIFPSE